MNTRTDLAELRRLWEETAEWTPHWSDTAKAIHAALPALLDELEAAQEELRRLTQANGDLREERDRAVKEAQRQDAVAKGLRKERDALAADNARLRAAAELGECYMKVFRHEIARNNETFEGSEDQAEVDGDFAKVHAALAATPAQSRAAHDAAVKVAVLREVIEELREMARDRDDSAYDIAAYTVEQKADRIEKEAANG